MVMLHRGEVMNRGQEKQKIHKLNVALAIVIGVLIVGVIAGGSRWIYYRLQKKGHYIKIPLCINRMHILAKTMMVYGGDYEGRYPQADKWCDLLIELDYVSQKKAFICPHAVKNGDDGPCHFALNPDANASSSPDTVLLFPTKGGWNQSGGPEILITENHQNECFIVFVGGATFVINKEELSKLKWK